MFFVLSFMFPGVVSLLRGISESNVLFPLLELNCYGIFPDYLLGNFVKEWRFNWSTPLDLHRNAHEEYFPNYREFQIPFF